MIKLKNITDIKLADFIGVAETKTLRNWKNSKDNKGKKNLYNASKLFMYLSIKKEENNEEKENYNNFNLLIDSFKILENNIKTSTNDISTEVNQAMSTINDIMENSKTIITYNKTNE